MLIKQFQLIEFNEKEKELLPDFCEWLCEIMVKQLHTKTNLKKIESRLDYLYKVNWIHWINKKKKLTAEIIMQNIFEAFSYEEYRNNIWKIMTNSNVVIPNTYTLMDKLIRFIDFGDNNIQGTGMFSLLKNDFNFHKLNNLWNIFIINKLGYKSRAKIITD